MTIDNSTATPCAAKPNAFVPALIALVLPLAAFILNLVVMLIAWAGLFG